MTDSKRSRIVGGIIAALLFTKLYEPLMNKKPGECCCGKK